MQEYNQKSIEKKWQKYWKEQKTYKFDFNSKKKPYIIDNPPRYASGGLHVGHAVHYTHIDFAARYKRMKGYNVLFPLCFDVNGIPIEERVERKLGITRKDIDRHEFIKLCSEFAEKNIGEMIRQFEILGESMDDTVYYQTNAEYYRRLTQISFLKLYEKDLIYKGERPINWCPRCMTALADAEVVYESRKTKLNYIKFKSDDGFLSIATTRPELLSTCQLVAINPFDKRVKELSGKYLKTPIFNKEIKIIEDDKVMEDFGTGIVMICSIGDKDDLEWHLRYKLEIEKGIDEEGRMTDICGKYSGMKIVDARKQIIEDMKDLDLLIKQEDLDQEVGCCWRCHTPIEFLVKKQWFLKLLPFKKDVLDASDKIKWYPEFMKIRLEEWVNSLEWDWVISRQRYFATPIPIWECEKCEYVVVANEEQCYVDPTIDTPPISKCLKCNGKLIGCEDVFDTWMDSSISPLFNSFWKRDDDKFQKLYPNSLRPQSHDIIRTWAFYTILRCLLITKKPPFEEIMMGGFILAPDGKPMHASLGNVIDPLETLEEYGADAMRYYAGTCALGIDNSFRFKDVKRGVKLSTKLWNIENFINKSTKGFNNIDSIEFENLRLIDKWILSKYSKLVENVTKYMDNFKFDKAMKETEYFLWHELADHYIEMVKYRIYDDKDKSSAYILIQLGLGITKLLAPFLPHITEEVYNLYFNENGNSIHLSEWPKPIFFEEKSENNGELIKEIISEIRRWKSENGIPLSVEIENIEIVTKNYEGLINECFEDIKNTVRAKNLTILKEKELKEEVIGIKPIYAKIGPTFREKAGEIAQKIKSSNPKEIGISLTVGEFEIELNSGEKIIITKDYIEIEKALISHGKKVESLRVKDIIILIESNLPE